MGYEELSTYLPAGVNMLLLTKDAGLEPFSSNIIKLLMPFKSDDLIDTLRMLIPGSFSFGRRAKPPKPKPQRSDEEKKLIEKAKVTLMDRNGMTEPEAFRYIQKTSMDMGRTMIESAQMILMLNSE
jgi:response regulator NasT